MTALATPPTPVVFGLSPAAAQAGGPDFTLTINGAGFRTSSVVYWNGQPRTTTYSAGVLSARISAADVATAQTEYVSVTSGTLTSNSVPFFVTETAADVTAVNTGSATDGTATAGVDGGATTAAADGTGTLTVARYASDPTPATPPTSSTDPLYFDVNTTPGSTFGSVTLVVCRPDVTLYWYDAQAAAWLVVSPQNYDPTTGCATATLTLNSSPSTTQLSGTPFAALPTLASLASLTRTYATKAGVGTALQAKVAAAGAAESRGDTTARARSLAAYVNQVRALSGKALTVDQATALTALAQQL